MRAKEYKGKMDITMLSSIAEDDVTLVHLYDVSTELFFFWGGGGVMGSVCLSP